MVNPESTAAAKWHGATTTEKASAQEHFIDLCRMLGEPTPHEADPIGAQYAFEKRVSKAAGGDGFADVGKRDFFAGGLDTGWLYFWYEDRGISARRRV